MDQHSMQASAMAKRHRPGELPSVSFTVDSDGEPPATWPEGAFEITIQATRADGEFSDWLTDDWWADLLAAHAERDLSVRVLPTSGAMLHPTMLLQCEMLRRVVPRWRLVGESASGDWGVADPVPLIASSPYHEVRLLPARANTGDRGDLPPERLAALVLQEQRRLRRRTPVVVVVAPDVAAPVAPQVRRTDGSAAGTRSDAGILPDIGIQPGSGI